MRYDSFLLYADEGQPGFSRFRLPMLCPGNPDDKIVRVRVLIGKNGGTMVDDDFTDKRRSLMGTRTLTSLIAATTLSTTPTMPMMAPTAKGYLRRRRRGRRRGGNEQPNATIHAGSITPQSNLI